jgi:hypothetical protein
MPEAAAACRFRKNHGSRVQEKFSRERAMGQTGPFGASLTVISQRTILGQSLG